MDVEVRENGATVAVSEGDRLLVRVPEVASAGYQWSVEELTGPLELEASELAFGGPATPGAAAERVVALRAAGGGEGRLVLALRRPWEREEPAADRFRVAVTVA
jgi:predicted secreted protein